MRKLAFIFILLPFFGSTQTLNYTNVEVLSLGYFNEFEYKKLFKLGEQALDEKIDFYELRARLGIAYYKQEKFENAWPHFLKAIEMNPSEEVILNYAYYSLLNTAQYNRANALLVKYPNINSKIKPKEKGLLSFELEPGFILSNNANNFEGTKIRNSNTNYAIGNFFSGLSYLRGFSDGLVSPDLSWHLGGNVFQSRHLAKLQFFGQDYEENYSSINYQVNAGLTQRFKKGYTFAFGLSYYHQNFPYPHIIQPNNQITDTTESSNVIAVSTLISKRMKFIEPIAILNYGNFDFENRFQLEAGITYFPLGKDKLYGYSSMSFISQNATSSYAYNQKIGYNIMPSLTLEASHLGGSLNNYMSALGYLTLNTFDVLNWSTGLDANIRYKRLTITPGYRFQKREGAYEQEVLPLPNIASITFNYYSQLFYITLKCQF